MQNEQLVEYSLWEERNALHSILLDCRVKGLPGTHNTKELIDSLVGWGNSLIMRAASDEPGRIQLIPPEEPGSRIIETKHQSIGQGSGIRDCME